LKRDQPGWATGRGGELAFTAFFRALNDPPIRGYGGEHWFAAKRWDRFLIKRCPVMLRRRRATEACNLLGDFL
jgi:hypothetical protein